MSDENFSVIGLFTAFLSWVGINAAWVGKLQGKVSEFPRDYVAKDDFREWKTELKSDINGIHKRLDTLIERRNKPRD